jgi:kynurenine formamidase
MSIFVAESKRVSLAELGELTGRYSNWGRWGADDELGTLNFITPERVAAAAAEVRHGDVYSLSIPFGADGPQRGEHGRFNPIHLMIQDGGDALTGGFRDLFDGQDRNFRGTDDVIIMPLQCATQWDSLAHVIHKEKIYNGYSCSEVSSTGAKKNGIVTAQSKLAGRGVLLDIPRARGVAWLEPGEGLTPADLDDAASRQGVDVQEGDIVLLRTGQMALVADRGEWGDYVGGDAPGLALESLDWLYEKRIAAIATDTWGFEVRPNQTPDVFQPLHIVAIVYMGLMIGEIFNLEELAEACAADGRYSFLFSALPLPIKGAVGSPINPMALK